MSHTDMACLEIGGDVYDAPLDGKDYIVQLRVKNGPLLRAMRSRGFRSVAALARVAGAHHQMIRHYLNLTRAPLTRSGKWPKTVLKIARALRFPPAALFPEQHLERALARNSGELEVSKEEVALLVAPSADDPEEILQRKQLHAAIYLAIESLPPREKQVIEERVLDESKTADEIGAEWGVTRERVRQIEARALRYLKRPSAIRNIRAAAPGRFVAA